MYNNCTKYLLAYMLLLTIPYVVAMEKNHASEGKPRSHESQYREAQFKEKIRQLKPFQSEPFNYVPQFLYENPNQITQYSWNADHFSQLKKAVARLTRESLKEQLKKEYESLSGDKKAVYNSAEELRKRAESYDWIHALNLIEQNYLKNSESVSLQDMQKINAAIRRTCYPTEGKLRTKPMVWLRRTLTDTETVFFEYVSAHVKEIRERKDQFLSFDPTLTYVNVASIRKLLEHCKSNPGLIRDKDNHESTFITDIDLQEIERWLSLYPASSQWEGYLNYNEWNKDRFHTFPPHESLNGLFDLSLTLSTKMAGAITLGGFWWYTIMKLALFDDADLRTGRAVTAGIFLSHGFLPPLIAEKDSEQLIKFVMKNSSNQEGALEFVEYVAGLVQKTQEFFKGKEVLNMASLSKTS